MTLDKGSRDAIARTVAQLRALFEAEFSQLAAGRYGLHTERRAGAQTHLAKNNVTPGDLREDELRPWVESLDALSLTPGQVIQRQELVGAVDYLHHDGLDGGQAVARLVREAAFTAVNRLLAVRVAETIGVLPEATSSGRQSRGYRDVIRDLFPLLANEADEGFWLYLQICGDELGATVPLLFDRRLPTSAFVPSRACIDSALTLINDTAVAHVWAEPEALGWSYQFFNTEDERQQMRAESPAPRNSRELAVRNQFFTPRYVVDWLVQNTLGRRLLQAGFQVDVPLLVGDVGDPAPLELDQVRVLDPAVGSGHFLLGCYDLLERAWASIGVGQEEAAPRILPCLFGVDIDPRASQVAQAVLLLRARRAAPKANLEPPRIVTARALPGDPHVRSEVFRRLSENARDLAIELHETLSLAPLLGPLLKVEARLEVALDRVLTTPKLATEVTLEALEEELQGALQEIARRADATAAERMFAADAVDAIRFVEICRSRYEVVLMNPPFGDGVPETNDYLRAAYGKSAINLYATFVDRGLELLSHHGLLGAISDRNGFFITTFEPWRSERVIPRLRAMLDLGIGVMHKAMVEAAAYVAQSMPHHGSATFRRLLGISDKAEATYGGLGETFDRRPADFKQIPGTPAAYWLSEATVDLFENNDSLSQSSDVDVKQGLVTADDFRFVRLWWEVPSSELGLGHRWVPFAKGGEYSPYYSHIYLVVDWEDDGRRLKEWGRGRVQNTQHYFRPGLTWPYKSDTGFCVRPVPRGCIFSHKGCMIFVESNDSRELNRLLAFLNSGVASALLEGMVAFGKYEVGAVQRLPHVETPRELSLTANELTITRMEEAQQIETDYLFVSPWVQIDVHAESLSKRSREVDESVTQAIGESEAIVPISTTHPTRWFEELYVRVDPPKTQDEISYLLGGAFGRWDIRIGAGVLAPPPLPDPYEPLPRSSRAMLVGEDGVHSEPPEGYPIAVPSNSILHDEAGHAQDAVAAIEAAADAIMAGPRATGELAYRREVRDLRQHLRSRFFSAHLKQYAGSQRYAPIYWQLAVPSRKWGLWLYAPRLSREMVFAIASAARDKLRRLTEQSKRLQEERVDSAERVLVEQTEALESLANEVEAFAEVAEGVAQSGWRPDLNDGFVLCAAPLEGLFVDRAWKSQIAKHREKLEKGAYPWATVQQAYFRSQR